jgi:radical SAM superfamily enzyme YgiQ (UPF0313 family)
MSDILLAALNSKYIHSSFGLRYLQANLGELEPLSTLAEYDIIQRPVDIAESILAHRPRLIGLGVYIWNVGPATELVAILKRLAPDVVIILGGPEVSHETEGQRICQLADYVITGEADLRFAQVCRELLGGRKPESKVLPAALPDFSQLALPYRLYTEQDIAHRILYVEASRGCPFSCEFCLSSLDIPVRQAPLDSFLREMDGLIRRGARHLKFVDRTFNLNLNTSRAILEFLRERYQPGMLFHFEMVPDRLPEELRASIAQFPPGALQFEVGIQTFNPEAAQRIQRRQNYERLEANLKFLRTQTGVHIHADLIVGLPGESAESFAQGFDRLIGLQPHEIQVGILKRLRGTPISRHDQEWQIVYNPNPPYELLRNRLLPFPEMQRFRRFARYWDLVGNSGNFVCTTPLIWEGGSPFAEFMRWSDWLFARTRRTDGIALSRLMELLFEYLTKEAARDPMQTAMALWRDYCAGGRRDKPQFLKDYLPAAPATPITEGSAGLKRQARHLRPTAKPPA